MLANNIMFFLCVRADTHRKNRLLNTPPDLYFNILSVSNFPWVENKVITFSLKAIVAYSSSHIHSSITTTNI